MPAWGQSYYIRALILGAHKPRIVMMMMMIMMIRIQDYEVDKQEDDCSD